MQISIPHVPSRTRPKRTRDADPAVRRASLNSLRLLKETGAVPLAVEALADPELAADDVRLAVRALAAVTGEVGVEDILDRLFATFCIGK